MINTPPDQAITRQIKLPLYYTGLIEKASVQSENAKIDSYPIDRSFRLSAPVAFRRSAVPGY